MALPHASEFDSFTSDFDKVNRIDIPTHTKRKIYDNASCWLVFPNRNFSIRLGETKPSLNCFLKKAGEQFGDPITPLNMANFTVMFRCFDNNENTIIVDTATITNITLGEVSYQFKALDFSKPGRYFGEFEFTESGSSFTLPSPNDRIEIIVS